MSYWTKIRDALHHNEFVALTPLSGLSFVHAARSTREAAFWYALIVAFLAITIYNVRTLVIEYNARPTRSTLTIRSSMSNLSLPNLTLVFEIPITEFGDQTLLPYGQIEQQQNAQMFQGFFKPGATQRFGVLQDFICNDREYPFDWHGAQTLYDQKAIDAQIELLDRVDRILQTGDLLQTNQFTSNNDFGIGDPLSLDKWLHDLEERKTSFINFWTETLFIAREKQNRTSIMAELFNLMNWNDFSYAFLELLALESLKVSSAASVPIESKGPDLFRETQAALSKIIRFGVEPLETLSLSDVKYKPPVFSEVAKHWQNGNLTYGRVLDVKPLLQITFSLAVPSNVKSIKISTYTFADLWYKWLLDAIWELFSSQAIHSELMPAEQWRHAADIAFCGDYEKVINVLDDFLTFWQRYYAAFTKLSVKFAADTAVHASPHHVTDMTVVPSILFDAKIDTCFRGTLASCIEQCEAASFMDKCACVPWTHAYLDDQTPICERHCDANPTKILCDTQCRQLINHPCDLAIFQLNTQSVPIDYTIGGATGFELFKININIPTTEHSYPRTTEEYEWTAGSFLSTLGGSLEFWSAINVLSVIHLLVFAFTKFIYKSNSSASEGQPDLTIESVKEELSNEIDSMHSTSKKNTLLTWFHSNSLFEQTPMAGYSYIASAKTLSEALFWCFIIFFFAIVMNISLYGTIVRYHMRPTYVSLLPSIATQQMSIPNLTLRLELPLIELGNMQLKLPYGDSDYYYQDYYDLLMIWQLGIATVYEINKNVIESWEKALWKPLAQLLNAQSASEIPQLAANSKMSKWQAQINESLSKFQDQLYQTTLLPNWKFEFQSRIAEFYEGPLNSKELKSLVPKLLILEAIRQEWTPWKLLSDQLVHTAFVNETQLALKEFQIVDWTVDELLRDVLHTLNNLLSVSVVGAQDASAYFTHFELDALDFQIKLDIALRFAPGTDKVEIEVNSLTHDWVTALYSDLIDDPLKYFYHLQDQPSDFTHAGLLNGMALESLIGIHQEYLAEKTHLHLFTENNFPIPIVNNLVVKRVVPHIGIIRKWQSISETNDCASGTYEQCTAQCNMDQHRDTCGCVPWFMYDQNLLATDTFCNDACNKINASMCAHNCFLRTYCHWEIVDFLSPVEADEEISGIYKFHLSTKKSLHPELIERYELTEGSFIGELGALLDFWLGVNILAVVHLLIYFLKLMKRRLQNSQEPHEPKSLIEKEKELDAVKAKMHEQLKTLRDAAAHPKENAPSRFAWFYNSNFYEETVVTGFAFIPAAKSRVEAVFWWLLILTFTSITIYNVHNAIQHYNTKPTHVSMDLVAVQDSLEMGNLTLEFNLPLFALLDTAPMKLDFQMLQYFPTKSVVEYFACALLTPSEYMYHEDMFKIWLQSDLSSLGFPDQPSTKSNLSEWLAPLEDAASSLMELLEQHEQMPSPKKQPEKKALNELLTTVVNHPMDRLGNVHMRLLVLEAMATGDDPRAKFYSLIETEGMPNSKVRVSGRTYDKLDSAPMDELLANTSALELFQKVKQDINSMLHVSSRTRNDLKVAVKELSYEPGATTYHLILHVVPPKGTSDIDIEMRYFVDEWHLLMYKTLYDYYVQRNKLETDICTMGKIHGLRDIQRYTMGNALLFDDYYAETDNDYSLSFGTIADQITIQPYKHAEIEMHSTSQFFSHTEHCTDGAFDRCVGLCVLQNSIQHCSCQPWTSAYLTEIDPSTPICTEPCAATSEAKTSCQMECENSFHPCEMSLYKLYYDQKQSNENYNNSAPVYSLQIKHLQPKHITYSESYEYTFGNLITQLAGLLELWMGINLLAIIHFLIYVIKAFWSWKRTRAQISPQTGVAALAEIQRLEEVLLAKIENAKKDIKLEIIKGKK